MNKTEVENTLTEHNGFVEAKEYILNQVKKPVKHVTFWFAFCFGIIVLAASGLWFEVIKYIGSKNSTDGIKVALIFFILPLINTAALQLCLHNDLKKSVKAAVFSTTFIIDLICWLLLFFNPPFYSFSYLSFIIIGLIISLLMAWLQSSLNEDFYDYPTPDAPIGGSTENPLQGKIPSDFKS
jgi:hypothetical protein